VSPMESMTMAIESVLRQPAAHVIGWALLHFVWQGTVIGALTALVLAALRRAAADVRYIVAAIALSLMVTLPLVTATQMWRAERAASSAARTASAWPLVTSARASANGASLSPCLANCSGVAPTPIGGDSGAARPGGDGTAAVERSSGRASVILPAPTVRIDRWLPVLVLGWLCGVVLLTLRLISGWLWVQRMKSHGAVPAGERWQHIASRLARRLHVARHIRLLESAMVEVPTVIGWIKPVVLLPASALAGLGPRQLEAILAHELAHIRRHDYLVNLLQTVVETLLFYHPAVWWLSRRIRIERENCCDDLAVSLCGDPYTYAKALTDLEELRGVRGQLVIAASGGSLVQRVRRLLGEPAHGGSAPGWLAGSATILIMLGIGAGAVGGQARRPPEQRESAPVLAPAPSSPSTTALAPPQRAADRQRLDEARATAAAAKRLEREAYLLQQAAEAATWLQHATNQATTPILAGQTLAARAEALHEAARSITARTESSRAGLAHSDHVAPAMDAAVSEAVPALATAGLAEPAAASTRATRSTARLRCQRSSRRLTVRRSSRRCQDVNQPARRATAPSPGP
jgi:beta-lactamase regulating signal transducer with metallopeptidase domain